MIQDVRNGIKTRRSVRAFDGQPLEKDDLERLCAFLETVENPYGLPVTFRLLDGKELGLSSPVVSGSELFLGAKIGQAPHFEEAFGYSFETVVLYAWSLGIGTVWIGGTMKREHFERAMELAPGERMPCVTPLGYPAKRMSVKETLMRRGVGADRRQPFEMLFFDGGTDRPLTVEKAGVLRDALEAVRLAPSAVNKQPWRCVIDRNTVHFYEKQTRGYTSEATGDLQKVDLGIALCHFDLAARESGLSPRFAISDPGREMPADTRYIATFVMK
ncbi:MAG: nitroreductase family protein [Clostridia bacterium]|nr:nitroreductase family protein [Clostridia bacterium]